MPDGGKGVGLTEKQFGGWSLLIGTVAVGLGYALSPGRGAVDTVPSNSLTDLTLAMARNQAFAYTVPIVIIVGGLFMLHGLLTLRRHTGQVAQLGLLGVTIGFLLQMVVRGLDYMITGMGVAVLESSAEQSEQWLQSALEMQRMAFGLHFTSGVAGFAGGAILALGLAFRPEPLHISPKLNGIAAALALAALAVFVAAWHSDELELALAPAFAAMPVGGVAYMSLLGWRMVSPKPNRASHNGSSKP